MSRSTIKTILAISCSSGSNRTSNFRFFYLCFLLCCLCLSAGLPLAGCYGDFEGISTATGNGILVLSQVGGTNGRGALFLVNRTTGERTVLSDFGNPGQGNLGASPGSVAVGASGRIFVSDLFAGEPGVGGALFEVDPDTGNRTLISNFGQGDIQGILAYGLTVDAEGNLIANLDQSTEEGSKFAVVRIDPETDERIIVSDLTNPAQGNDVLQFRKITDLTLEHSGEILLGTSEFAGEPNSNILRVHPVTGNREVLSNFGNPSQGSDVGDLDFSAGIAVESSGEILVASGFTVVAPRNLLFRINPETGQRTVLSDFDNPSQGTLGTSLRGVAVEKSGDIIVGAGDAATASSDTTILFRVNPDTGQRTLLSDPDNPEQGPAFVGIVYIAIR